MNTLTLITSVVVLLILVQGADIVFKTYTGIFPGGCYPVSLNQGNIFTASLSWTVAPGLDLDLRLYKPLSLSSILIKISTSSNNP
jgi:hypothetical protein